MIKKFNREYINSQVKSDPKAFVQECESCFNRQMDDVLLSVIEEHHRVVCVAGPSSSGKTTFASMLSKRLEDRGYLPTTMSLDDYFINKSEIRKNKDGKYDFESIDIIDVTLLAKNLLDIASGKTVRTPVYNFATGKREEFARLVEGNQNRIVILEGLHAFDNSILEKVPDLHPLRVYISVENACRERADGDTVLLTEYDIRFLRRMVRDYFFRACPPERTFELWESVLAGEQRNILPVKKYADIYINSVFLYEPCVMKSFAGPIFKAGESNAEFQAVMDKLVGILEGFEQIDAGLIPQNSLLREFIGKEEKSHGYYQ